MGSFHNDYTAFWSLKNPNGTAKIVVTMGGSTGVVIGAYALSEVDQTNPIPTTATYYRSSGNPTISLNTLYANSVVLDSPAIWGGVTLGSPTCTKQWNATVTTNQVSGASSNKTQATPGAVTCGWTASGTGNGWDDSAIEVKASGAASVTTPIVLNSKSTAAGNGIPSPFKITMYKFSPGNGSNRLLVVGVSASSKSATSVKFGTASLTQAVSSFHHNDAEFWYLKNPSSTPADLVVTMSGTTPFAVGTYSFSGVDQAIPIATTNSTNNTSSSSPKIAITTLYANSTVLDLPSIYGGVTLGSPTCTQQWDMNIPSGITGASSNKTQTTPGKVTCAWTASGSGDLWDDVAVEIKASISWHSNTGILEPMYCDPYNYTDSNSTCKNTKPFKWQAVNDTANTYPHVPFFVIVNPDNGPGNGTGGNCSPNHSSFQNRTRDYQNGIGNLTRAGVNVLGYIHTSNANGGIPYSTAKFFVNQWVKCYKQSGLKGIFVDEMSNSPTTTHLNYYQNLTNYIHGNFTYSIGNPGTETVPNFIGTVDKLVFYENTNSSNSAGNINKLDNATLQGFDINSFSCPGNDNTCFQINSWHTQYDKSDFSTLLYNQSSITKSQVQKITPWTSLLFVTSDTASNVWTDIPSYLATLTSYLNNTSTSLHVQSFNGSNSNATITGFDQLIYQGPAVSNYTLARSSVFTPVTYNATQGWPYTINALPFAVHAGNCMQAH
ncbi:MAG: spherulation-specific family 4 protein, partial [Nitrosotalea sp.]